MNNEIKKIVKDHENDFNILNESSFIKKKGGYSSYVKSLGNTFKELCYKTKTPKTVKEFQDICDYCFGLASIWGIDYDNGGTHHKWGNGSKDRYYTDKTAVYKKYYAGFSIDDMLSHEGKNPRPLNTNCNYFAQIVYGKCGFYKYKTTSINSSYLKSVGAKLLTKKEDLQPGDLIHLYDKNGKWHHVVVVYSVDYITGKVIVYDTGSRWITSKNPEKEFICNGSHPLGTYNYDNGKGTWKGVHFFDLIYDIYQDKTDTELAIESILGLHGNGSDRKIDLASRYDKVQKIINYLAQKDHYKELIDELTDYVLDGKAGKGDERKNLLGKYYSDTQNRVNEIVKKAEDVWKGKYGSGDTRREKLGSDYYIIMRQVNRTKDKHGK